MRHARKPIILVCALAATLLLAACGSSGGSSSGGGSVTHPVGTLRIMAEHEVLESAMLNPFEEANPGLKIEKAEVEGSSEAATKLSAGFNTDVVETCADEITPLIKRDMLQPIDTAKLAHWNELYPELRTAKGSTENGKQMFVPQQAGPHGLIYNTEDFPHGVDTIKELFNPALKGKVAMNGDDKSIIAMTAFALGIKEPFQMSPSELTKVGNYLIAHAGQFRAFPESDANQLNLMKSGEVELMDGGLGTANEMIAGGVPVKWVRPKEGMYSWVCGLAVTKNAKNVNAAYALINYYTSIKAQAAFGDDGYVVLNRDALPSVKPALRATADPASIAGATIEQTPENLPRWDEIYQQVVSG
jgi:spermidine/putrescine transport system substrate-binding protein